ncbi:hypothetical protein [Paraburkholderia sediminicola]|uniref:hypothetical protein n=1 Tax=Paraburkholderia sediminicola TaxID=458836 RepID=UPI0038B8A7A7
MNTNKALNIASAIAGFAGTVLMYRGTFGLVVPGGQMNTALLAETKKANDCRQLLQRTGLMLLTVSFLLQGIAQFTPE